MTAEALYDTGTIDARGLARPAQHRREGYADFVFRGDYASFGRRFWRAAWEDAEVRRNLGLWKLFAQSFLPEREGNAPQARGRLAAT